MKTYQEAQQRYLDQISGAQQGGGTTLGVTYLNLANFYYYCAFNLWTFAFNRAPKVDDTPEDLSFGTIDAFYDFFATVPADESYEILYTKAADAYLTTLPLFVDNKKQQASIYMQLSFVYDQTNEIEKSREMLESASILYKEINDTDGLTTILLQRAYNERYMTYDMKKAEEYLWEAYRAFETQDNKMNMASTLIKIADIYHPVSLISPDILKWEKYNTDAVDLFITGGDTESAVHVMLPMVDYYAEHDTKKEDTYIKKVKDLGFVA